MVLSEASGINAQAFGDQYLFQPLGFDGNLWESDSQGYPFGGHGLHLRTEDMAKLGVLFLNGGVFNQREIVATAWREQATAIERPL